MRITWLSAITERSVGRARMSCGVKQVRALLACRPRGNGAVQAQLPPVATRFREARIADGPARDTWRSGSAWVSFVRNGRFVLDAGYTRQQIDLSTATVFFAPAETEGFSVYDVGTDILFSQAEVKVHRRVAVNGGYQVVRSSGTYATAFGRATLGSTVSLSERYYVNATVWSGGYRDREAVTLGNFDYAFTQLVVNFG